MEPNEDRRLWSTTPRGLSLVLGKLFERGVPSTSARSLHKILKERNIYPVRDFEDYFEPVLPDAFITYHSAQNYVEIQEIAWKATTFASELLGERRPDIDAIALQDLASDGVRLWIDFLFIDQCARNIRQELNVLPKLLRGAQAHFVLGDQPLSRAWCCYEIALFNQQCAEAEMTKLELRSFIAPTRNIYFGWNTTDVSEEQDKVFIGEQIDQSFPHGFDGFNHVMNQVNATAVLSITETAPHYPPAALNTLTAAAAQWFDRM